jgi:hypothetical protein
LFEGLEAPFLLVQGQWGLLPIAFFACCSLCFDDYTEFIESFFWVLLFECWKLTEETAGYTFSVVIAIFDVNIRLFFFLIFIDKVVIN